MFKKKKQDTPAAEAPHPSDPSPTMTSGDPNFPSVGMTLASYNYDAFSAMNRTSPDAVKKQSWWRRFRSSKTLKRTLILIAIIILLLGVWIGGKFIYNSTRIFGGNIFDAFSSTKLRGEDEGRVNILLAGNSASEVGHGGADLTDSIMLVSIDTKNNSAFMLSIPRDLWVNIPGYGSRKINEAYVYGERDNFSESGYAAGGMGLLQKTISTHFGVTSHYYTVVNYNAFRDAVDAVGGVKVVIDSPHPRGLYDYFLPREGGPLRLANGTQQLDGRTALKLARARGQGAGAYGFPASDFDRTKHQRQLLLALKDKATSTGVLANPVRISSLMDALGSNVKTDLKLSEVRRLVEIGQKIDNNGIASMSLNDADGKNLLTSYRTPAGQSALVPAAGRTDFSDIKAYLKRLMSDDPLIREGAHVVVLNGTSMSGLAATAAASLQAKKITIDQVGDAPDRPMTLIIDRTEGKKTATLQIIKDLYGSNISTTDTYAGRYPTADVIVIIGANYQPASPSSAPSQ